MPETAFLLLLLISEDEDNGTHRRKSSRDSDGAGVLHPFPRLPEGRQQVLTGGHLGIQTAVILAALDKSLNP